MLEFQEGEILFHESELPKSLYLLKKGRVLLLKEFNGRIYPLKVVTPPGFIGEFLLENKKKTAGVTAYALEECELNEITMKEFNDFFASSPRWITELVHDFSTRLDHAFKIIAEHKIIDENLTAGYKWTDKKESLIAKTIKSYTSKG